MVVVLRVVFIAGFLHCTWCKFRIIIQPRRADLGETENVTIRCSFNLSSTQINKVYSIMLKRQRATVAVLFSNNFQSQDRRYSVDGTMDITHLKYVFLQVSWSNVTCSDKGDYSCITAVRSGYRNVQLGPVSSTLTVTGKPSPVSARIMPSKIDYSVGEVVMLTCSALSKTPDVDWLWTLTSETKRANESCSYNESDCVYQCTSSVFHSVTLEDNKLKSQCGYEGNLENIEINVGTSHRPDPPLDTLLEDSAAESAAGSPDEGAKEYTTSRITTPPTPETSHVGTSHTQGEDDAELRTVLTYSFLSALGLAFLCVFLYMCISGRCECQISYGRRQNTDNTNCTRGQSYMAQNEFIPTYRVSHFGRDVHQCQFDYLSPQENTCDTSTGQRTEPQADLPKGEHIYDEIV